MVTRVQPGLPSSVPAHRKHSALTGSVSKSILICNTEYKHHFNTTVNTPQAEKLTPATLTHGFLRVAGRAIQERAAAADDAGQPAVAEKAALPVLIELWNAAKPKASPGGK